MLKFFRPGDSIWKTTRNLLFPRLRSNDAESLFSPDSGRWLWNEEFQRSRHTRCFNIRALEDVVATAVGAQSGKSIVQIRKLAEGASNKVYTATIGSKRVIVKLPDPFIPSHLVTASEVATLEFLRTELDMPVPQVLAWSSTNDNPIGCEYIIMDEVQGDSLDLVWDTSFNFEAKLAVIDQVQSMQSCLIQNSILFGGYGSLYFSDDAKTFSFQKRLPVKSKKGITRFVLGPMAHPSFMHPEVGSAGISRGPWTSPQDYLVTAIDCSIARVKSLQEGREDPDLADTSFDFPYDTSSDATPGAALSLLRQYRLVAPALVPMSPAEDSLALPVIWHKDLHLGNIFVDAKGLITGIVDWQETYCLPLFFQAEVPSFSDYYQGQEQLELPQDFSSMPTNEKKTMSRRFLQTKLRQYYLASFSEDPSGISKILQNPSWASLRDLAVSVAGRSFTRKADFILLRELLLRIKQNWAEIEKLSGSDMKCPIFISDEELRKHRMDGRQWNEFKDVLKSRNIPINRAGWVHRGDFKEQKEALRHAIEDFMSSLEDKAHREQFQKKHQAVEVNRIIN